MPDFRRLNRPTATHFVADLRGHADTFTAGPLDPDADAIPSSRHGRRLLWGDGLVSNISESFVASYVNPFALALGATNTQIGWLSALTNLASALGLFPGARLADRATSRKKVVVWGSIASRLLIIAVAASPLLFGGQAAIYAFVALVSLRAFFAQLTFPAWSAMLADLIPTGIRGRYFGTRNIALALAALVFTPIAGGLAESIGLPRGYQFSFLIAGLIGLVATSIFARIPEPRPEAPPAAGIGRTGLIAMLRAHPRFTAFSAVAFLWNLSLMVAGPFFSVYMVRTLGATPFQIGILASVNALTNILGQRIWGRLNDRRGARWVMAVTGLIIPLIPALWAFAASPWALLPIEALSGLAWSGYSLSNFNLMLGLAPSAQRARYTALYQVSVFSAAFIGPLAGTALVNFITIPTLFMISGVGRLIASLLFMFTVRGDDEAH